MVLVSRIRTRITLTARGLVRAMPRSFFLAVDSGTSTTSSKSSPHEACPRRASTPTIVNGMRWTRITWPTGSDAPKSCSLTVWPMTATRTAPSRSCRVRGRPFTTFQSRSSRYSGVAPWMYVDQFRLPNTAWPPERTNGATVWALGTSRWMAEASSSVIVELGAASQVRAEGEDAARTHEDEIGAERAELRLHAIVGAAHQRHQHDDLRDADDDAEHGERAAQDVDAQGVERDPQARAQGHGDRLARGGRRLVADQRAVAERQETPGVVGDVRARA